MCGHRQLQPDCADCRGSVKFYDGEVGYQLHRIGVVCDTLQNLVEHGRVGNKTTDVVYNCLDELESIVEGISRETKASPGSGYKFNVDPGPIDLFSGRGSRLELGKPKR